jgi:hypothetical protein
VIGLIYTEISPIKNCLPTELGGRRLGYASKRETSFFLKKILAHFLVICPKRWMSFFVNYFSSYFYEGHSKIKERFAIKKYLLIIGKKKNMQVLSQTFTYSST